MSQAKSSVSIQSSVNLDWYVNISKQITKPGDIIILVTLIDPSASYSQGLVKLGVNMKSKEFFSVPGQIALKTSVNINGRAIVTDQAYSKLRH